MARGGSAKERERKARRDWERRPPAPPTNDTIADAMSDEATAFHEAAHAVVAHALGRRVVYMRTRPVWLPVGHPHNPTDKPFHSVGFNLSEPRLASQVSAAVNAGVPLSDEQTTWLRQEAVAAFAGTIAEAVNWGSPQAAMNWGSGDKDDLGKVAVCAVGLGRTVTENGQEFVAPDFHESVATVAATILVDLSPVVESLKDALAERQEMEADELDLILGRSPRGSHAHLLPT